MDRKKAVLRHFNSLLDAKILFFSIHTSVYRYARDDIIDLAKSFYGEITRLKINFLKKGVEIIVKTVYNIIVKPNIRKEVKTWLNEADRR